MGLPSASLKEQQHSMHQCMRQLLAAILVQTIGLQLHVIAPCRPLAAQVTGRCMGPPRASQHKVARHRNCLLQGATAWPLPHASSHRVAAALCMRPPSEKNTACLRWPCEHFPCMIMPIASVATAFTRHPVLCMLRVVTHFGRQLAWCMYQIHNLTL